MRMSQGPRAALRGLTALNARRYAPFDGLSVDWEGRPLPDGFGPALLRLRRAGPEARAVDPDAATEAFLFHYRLGLHYGYPECCVLQYAMEVPYASPLLLRGGIVLGSHVPCDACLEAYLHDYITDGPVHRTYPAPTRPD